MHPPPSHSPRLPYTTLFRSLSVDWNISPGGNSGIFYRGALGSEAIYYSAPEMQVLDDAGHADGQSPLTSAGSRSEEHTSELQSLTKLVCRLLLERKKS